MFRRWWASAAAIGLVAGILLAGMHAASIHHPDLREGDNRELTVVLISAARSHESQTGPWWSAKARVVAGAAKATVGLSGRGSIQAGLGDRLTAKMGISASRVRGESARLWVQGRPSVEPAQGPAAGARRIMRQVAGDTDPGWLLSGMSLGMDEGLSPPAQQDMRDSGLSHLTAVSGANCAVLLLLVHWLCGWLRVPRVPRMICGAVVLVAFVTTVGMQPSVMRAAAMAGLAMLAGLMGGRRAAAHVLQMSVVLLLLLDPWLAYSVGFMLSIAATGGLIALLERGVLAATVAAQVATFPILLAIGGSVGPRTVASNVLVTPMAAIIPIVGLGSALLEWVAGLGEPIAGVGRAMCLLVLRIAGWQVLPNLTWLPGWLGVGLAAVVALTAFTLGRRRMVAVTVVLVGAVWLTGRLADGWPPADWWIVACDVGQGDAFVVRSEQRIMLVDTGPEPALVDGCLDRLGVQAIDLVVITHFHADHVDGLDGVLDGRRVGQVWVSPCSEPAEQYAQAADDLRRLHATIPVPGDVYAFGAARLHVVWPQRIIAAGSVPNNASVSFVLEAPQGRAAFLGDLEPEAQAAILRSADLAADVVKVPHHGSAQFVPELPAAVRPELALIGVGRDNSFGHPSAQAVAAWQQIGAQVFATAQSGDIAVTGDRRVVVRGVVRAPLGR
jgi:competence protein ComEC